MSDSLLLEVDDCQAVLGNKVFNGGFRMKHTMSHFRSHMLCKVAFPRLIGYQKAVATKIVKQLYNYALMAKNKLADLVVAIEGTFSWVEQPSHQSYAAHAWQMNRERLWLQKTRRYVVTEVLCSPCRSHCWVGAKIPVMVGPSATSTRL